MVPAKIIYELEDEGRESKMSANVARATTEGAVRRPP